MEWVETTAKTVEAAKEAALDRLGVAADEAEFEVLDEPRPGLFGRTRGEGRVRARVKPAQVRPKQERRRRSTKGSKSSGDSSAEKSSKAASSPSSASDTPTADEADAPTPTRSGERNRDPQACSEELTRRAKQRPIQ